MCKDVACPENPNYMDVSLVANFEGLCKQEMKGKAELQTAYRSTEHDPRSKNILTKSGRLIDSRNLRKYVQSLSNN